MWARVRVCRRVLERCLDLAHVLLPLRGVGEPPVGGGLGAGGGVHPAEGVGHVGAVGEPDGEGARERPQVRVAHLERESE